MVVILLGTGFEEAEALVSADLMRRAGMEVVLTSINGESEVTGSHGITVKADRVYASFLPEDNVELVMLPGGLKGVENIRNDGHTLRFIADAYENGAKLAAICAAPSILAELGFLEGRKAVIYPGMESELAGAVPQPGSRVVEDGSIVTGEAAGSAFDFGLRLIEVLRGKEAAEKVRNAVHYHG